MSDAVKAQAAPRYEAKKNGSGTWYCRCAAPLRGRTTPSGFGSFFVSQKMRKCCHFRKSSFTDPLLF